MTDEYHRPPASGQARKRAIRARQAETGEPYCVAARKVDVEHTASLEGGGVSSPGHPATSASPALDPGR